jgi:hypothetical protein
MVFMVIKVQATDLSIQKRNGQDRGNQLYK